MGSSRRALEVQGPLGSLPGASSALKPLCQELPTSRAGGPGPKAVLLSGQVRPSPCSALQMGHQDHSGQERGQGSFSAACGHPLQGVVSLLQGKGEALSSRWAVLVTPNGGLTEEHSSLESKQTLPLYNQSAMPLQKLSGSPRRGKALLPVPGQRCETLPS